jgi:predicted transcriptional regulator
MKCRYLMNLEPTWISSAATAFEAARLMRDRSIGFLLLYDTAPGRLKGIITDRDLTTRVCAENKLPQETRLIDIATTEVVTCGDDEDLTAAEAKMQELELSRLVVVNNQGDPVGILSVANILHGDSGRRALKTARAVLTHDERPGEPPPEQITLTPSTPADEDAAIRQPSVIQGATREVSMKEFP